MHRLFGGFVFASALFAQSPALADPAGESREEESSGSGPATANVVQVGLGFRYGLEFNDGDLNPWGAGLGLDVGYTLPQAVYLGGTFEYFFGETETSGTIEAKANAWHLLGELGYDLSGEESVVVRPKVGFGLATVRTGLCGGSVCDSSEATTNPALVPGLKVMFITPRFSLSLDTRYAMVFAESTGKALIFTLGVGF